MNRTRPAIWPIGQNGPFNTAQGAYTEPPPVINRINKIRKREEEDSYSRHIRPKIEEESFDRNIQHLNSSELKIEQIEQELQQIEERIKIFWLSIPSESLRQLFERRDELGRMHEAIRMAAASGGVFNNNPHQYIPITPITTPAIPMRSSFDWLTPEQRKNHYSGVQSNFSKNGE